MFSSLVRSFGELQQSTEHRLDLLMEGQSALLEMKENCASCGFWGGGKRDARGVLGLVWCSLRVSSRCFAGAHLCPCLLLFENCFTFFLLEVIHVILVLEGLQVSVIDQGQFGILQWKMVPWSLISG